MSVAISAVSSLVAPVSDELVSGSVHSVFNTSLNLELGGRLVHLGSDAAPLSCFGATMGEREMAALIEGVRAGDTVRMRDGIARIYSRAGVSELALGAAPVRDLTVPRLETLPRGLDEALSAALSRVGLTELIGLPWPDRSRAAVTELARFSVACARSCGMVDSALSDEESNARYQAAVRAMRGSVEYLLGRGLGLTPSGDDVLTGFGCALHLLYGGGEIIDPFLEAVAQSVPGRTTAVSEAYLFAMLEGYANEDYVDLARDLARGRIDRLAEHVTRILEMGHTSGADSLLGFGAAFGCLM